MPADLEFTELRTTRLVIRRFRAEDAVAFTAYRSDPGVARYQSWDSFTIEQAETFIAEMSVAHPGVPGEWFQFAVAELAGDELIGDVAICVHTDDPSRAELGFTLAPGRRGKGYATEAVRAVIAYAFERLGARTVLGIADARNEASIALLERVGMRRTTTESVRFKGEWCDEHTYELRRDEG